MSMVTGWYPQKDGRDRYWDGERWTDAYRPAQEEVTAGSPKPVVNVAPPKPAGWAEHGWLWAGLIAAGLFVVFIIVHAMSTGSTGTNDDVSKEVDCQALVKQQLVNPSTANFDGYGTVTSTEVSGTLTAQNKLGGTVTMSYSCPIVGGQIQSPTVTDR